MVGHHIRRVAGRLLFLPGVAAPVLAAAIPWSPTPLWAQEGALPDGVEVEATLRPRQVRVGDRVLLTLRVRLPAERELVVEELPSSPGLAVLDVSDRSSVAVGAAGAASVREVVWTLEPVESGTLIVPGLSVWVDRTPFDVPVGSLEVSPAPLRRAPAVSPAPAPRTRNEPPVLPEGRPPPTGGEDAAVIPGGRPAGDGLVVTRPGGPGGTLPYGGHGRYPGYPGGVAGGILLPGGGLVTTSPGGFGGLGGLGGPGGVGWPPRDWTTGSVSPSDGWSAGAPGGWAESAREDPYWEELVPRVQEWSSVVRDPTGGVELSTGVSPGVAWVGQQVTFLAAAGFTPDAAYRMSRDPEYFAPAPRDVWQVDVARFGAGYVGASRGELQDVRPFVQAFFPLRPGTLTIPGASLAYGLGGAGRFLPADTLRADPVTVEVRPIPVDQAPAGWDGAVGRYTVGVILEQDALAPGEASVLTLTVRGAGNVESLPAPRPTNLRGVTLRPLGERAVVEVRDGVVGGVKIFQWLVSVVEPGQLSLGPFLMPYFDPWAGAFEVAATREVLLEAIGAPAP